MTCKSCGAEIADGAKFCENCGNKIEEPVNETVNEAVNETVEEKEPERVEAEVVSGGASESTYSEKADASASSVAGADIDKGPQGYSIASLVCGILGLLCCCCGWIGLVISVAGIILGIISLNKNCEGRGMAIAGIVCGGIGALVALTGVIVAAATGSIADSLNVDELYDIIDSF